MVRNRNILASWRMEWGKELLCVWERRGIDWLGVIVGSNGWNGVERLIKPVLGGNWSKTKLLVLVCRDKEL